MKPSLVFKDQVKQGKKYLHIIFFLGLIPLFSGCGLTGTDPDRPRALWAYSEFGSPVMSPDMKSIAFYWDKIVDQYTGDGMPSRENDSVGIWMVNLESGNASLLYQCYPMMERIEYSTGGDSLFFVDLYFSVLNIPTKAVTKMQLGFYGHDISLSPDGKVFIFCRGTAIAIAGVNDSLYRYITTNDTAIVGQCPDWFPDNRRFVYLEAGRRIVVNDTSGNSRKVLFDPHSPGVGSPSVSPDGEYIVFSFEHSCYIMRSDGSDLRCLLTYAGGGVWSPDGKKLLISRAAIDQHYYQQRAIWIMNADGTNARQLFPKVP